MSWTLLDLISALNGIVRSMANSSYARSISSGIVRIMKDFMDLGRMVDEILGPLFSDVLSLYKLIVALYKN
jgi:hypothetical protein